MELFALRTRPKVLDIIGSSALSPSLGPGLGAAKPPQLYQINDAACGLRGEHRLSAEMG